MARTAAGAALTARQRGEQLRIRSGMLRDLLRAWQVVDPTNLSGTIDRFASLAVALIRPRHVESARSAERYFELFRRAEGLPGILGGLVVPPPPDEQIADTVRGAGLAGIIRARRAGQSPEAAARNGLVKVSGSASSLVLAGARSTLLELVSADGRAAGWQRVTSADPCPWCADRSGQMLREAVFGAHDHCSCTAEPAYE